MRRVITAGAQQQWRLWLEEVNREGEAVWRRSTRESQARGVESTFATQDGLLVHSHGLLQRVRHGQQGDDSACEAGSHLRAGANDVCGQVLRRESSWRVLSGGLGGARGECLLQRGAARRPYGTGDALLVVATEDEAFPCTEVGEEGVEAYAYMEDTPPRSRGDHGKHG